ncbi:MAG: hypothetical protein DME33_08820 [Verrucomicrobia bacterium]|nr:MAG: hypothetical protein DME33_08820 [Verrucomicrobiota bacterium]
MFPLPTGHTVVIATATKLDVSGNFGFETPVVGDGRWQSVPAYAAWTFTWPAGISGNHSGYTSGNPPAPEVFR